MDGNLKKVINRITEEIDPDKVILFGSQAKGEGKKWSDYDICVLKSDAVKRNDLEKKIYLKLFGVGVAGDIKRLERFSKLKENHFLIYNQIAKYVRPVYEKSWI